MFVQFIKFIHVLFAIGLIGGTSYCLVAVGSKKFNWMWCNKHLIYFSIAALITGVLLVYPTHFTFHTAWIKAAFLLVFVFCTGILILFLIKNKIALKNLWFWRVMYLALVVILILITHDAVTKTTFLF